MLAYCIFKVSLLGFPEFWHHIGHLLHFDSTVGRRRVLGGLIWTVADRGQLSQLTQT
jgi:hypothetical protein